MLLVWRLGLLVHSLDSFELALRKFFSLVSKKAVCGGLEVRIVVVVGVACTVNSTVRSTSTNISITYCISYLLMMPISDRAHTGFV